MQIKLDSYYIQKYVTQTVKYYELELEKLEEEFFTSLNGKYNKHTGKLFQTRNEIINYAKTIPPHTRSQHEYIINKINRAKNFGKVCEMCRYSGNEDTISLDFNDLEFLGMLDDTEQC